MSLRAGVAGAGVFGGYHAQKYAESNKADLVAIFDIDAARAQAGAEKQNGQAYSDYEQFLEAVDVVTIATPASTHGDLARQALLAGKHVLVEKPIALDLATADELIKLAVEKKLTLQVGHQERYVFDAFGLLARPMAPKRMESRRLNKFSGRCMDVSVVYDLMIHDLDLIAQLLDATPQEIMATQMCEHGPHSDHTETRLGFMQGEARLAASRMVDTPVRDMRLVYEDGEIHLDFLTRKVTNSTDTPLARDFDQGPEAPHAFRDPLGFGTEQFLQSVESGQPPIVTGGHGRRALAMALAIEQAASQSDR